MWVVSAIFPFLISSQCILDEPSHDPASPQQCQPCSHQNPERKLCFLTIGLVPSYKRYPFIFLFLLSYCFASRQINSHTVQNCTGKLNLKFLVRRLRIWGTTTKLESAGKSCPRILAWNSRPTLKVHICRVNPAQHSKTSQNQTTVDIPSPNLHIGSRGHIQGEDPKSTAKPLKTKLPSELQPT